MIRPEHFSEPSANQILSGIQNITRLMIRRDAKIALDESLVSLYLAIRKGSDWLRAPRNALDESLVSLYNILYNETNDSFRAFFGTLNESNSFQYARYNKTNDSSRAFRTSSKIAIFAA